MAHSGIAIGVLDEEAPGFEHLPLVPRDDLVLEASPEDASWSVPSPREGRSSPLGFETLTPSSSALGKADDMTKRYCPRSVQLNITNPRGGVKPITKTAN